MAARRKPEDQKTVATIPVRVTKALKEDVDEMAEATAVPTSERVRDFLQVETEKFKKSRKSKRATA